MLQASHGGMGDETFPSDDSEICRRVRETMGRRVPMAMHDLHAGMSPDVVGDVDGLAGYWCVSMRAGWDTEFAGTTKLEGAVHPIRI